MDDLSSMLGNILKDPESMEKIRNLAGMLGMSGSGSPSPASPEPPPPDPARQEAPNQQDSRPLDVDPDSLRMVAKLAPMISRFRQEDDSTRLLRALRPFLKEEKQKKLDEAIRLMQIVRMLPLIRKSGLF